MLSEKIITEESAERLDLAEGKKSTTIIGRQQGGECDWALAVFSFAPDLTRSC